MGFDIQLNGLRKRIQSMQEMAGHIAIDIVNELSEIGEAQAKGLAQVDTGEMRAATHIEPAKIEDGIVKGGFYNNSDHAIFVEYGTGQRGVSGEVANGQEKDPDASISYRADWKGMRAYPFFYPASKLVAEAMPEVLEKYGTKLMGGST